MGKILRVGNLGSTIDATKLKEIFSEVGTVVHVKMAESQYSGLSRGFGYVEMANDNQAADCIERLHGKDHSGRVLTVADAPNEKPKSRSRAKGKAK
jgi:cold-inducible RNA-binding protein